VNANQRSALYAVAAALMPILVAYGLLSDAVAPLFLALFGAVLAAIPPVVAFRNVTPDEVEFDPELDESLADPEPED
jgi:hypothetical protein